MSDGEPASPERSNRNRSASPVLRNSRDADREVSSEKTQTSKKGKKRARSASRSLSPTREPIPKKSKSSGKKPVSEARREAARKAAATRKEKADKLGKLEERLAFFENVYREAEAEVHGEAEGDGDGGSSQAEPAPNLRPGDPGYNPGVGEPDETLTAEEAEALAATESAMGGSSAGGASAVGVPQRQRVTARRSSRAFNSRVRGRLAGKQGVVVSRGRVVSRVGSKFSRVHAGMSPEELSKFKMSNLRANQYA